MDGRARSKKLEAAVSVIQITKTAENRAQKAAKTRQNPSFFAH
jgi:hypothetical protein